MLNCTFVRFFAIVYDSAAQFADPFFISARNAQRGTEEVNYVLAVK